MAMRIFSLKGVGTNSLKYWLQLPDGAVDKKTKDDIREELKKRDKNDNSK